MTSKTMWVGNDKYELFLSFQNHPERLVLHRDVWASGQQMSKRTARLVQLAMKPLDDEPTDNCPCCGAP